MSNDPRIAEHLVAAFNDAVAGHHPIHAGMGWVDDDWILIFRLNPDGSSTVVEMLSCHQGTPSQLAAAFAASAGTVVAAHGRGGNPDGRRYELEVELLPALCAAALGVTA